MKIFENVYAINPIKAFMKKCVLLFFAVIFGFAFAVFSANMKFPKIQLDPNVEFKTYEAIALDNIDTEDIRIDLGPSSDDALNSQDEIRNRIASELRRRFREMLGLMLRVGNSRDEVSGSKALMVNVKLSGIVAGQSGFNQTENFSFKTEAFDADSGDKAFELSNDYRLVVDEKSSPTSKGPNLDGWFRAADLWAIDFSNYLKHQINIAN
ncbi:MAG: hypothetical protein PHP17_06970 [Candidatus Omnitrophica bacterium]|nr:hypothetical protein [Candidatus Omnitrophota bacterium]